MGINPELSFRFGSYSDCSCKGHTAVILNHRQQLTVTDL